MINHSVLTSLLHYDPETGAFTWIAEHRSGVPSHRCAGCPDTKGYTNIVVAGNRYKAHRLAWLYMTGVAPSGQIDHINKIKDDNRWGNLRDVSGSVNQQNRNRAMTTSSTQLLGAFKNGTKFCAKIHIDSKQIYLGTFTTAEEAHLAYITAKALCHEGYIPC